MAIKEYLFAKETSSSTDIGTVKYLPDSLWVQLKKFPSLISWPLWSENWQKWIIKIGAEFITQISLVFSERTLQEGQNHLFWNDKISGLRDWLTNVWMSAGTGRVIVYQDFDILYQNLDIL